MNNAGGICAKTLILSQCRKADRVAEPLKEIIVTGKHHDPAVAALECLIRHNLRHARTLPHRELSRCQIGGKRNSHPDECRLVKGGIDDASSPGASALDERCKNTERRPYAGADVDNGNTHPHRGSAVLSHNAHQSAMGLHQRVIARAIAERPDPPESAEIAIDEARLLGGQDRGGKPKFVKRTEFQILHHHVHALENKASQSGNLGRIREIDGNPALGAIDRLEGCRGAAPKWRSPVTAVVSFIGVLELDHIGAKLAEDHSGDRRGNAMPDLEHRNACQRTRTEHLGTPQPYVARPARSRRVAISSTRPSTMATP